MTPMYDPSCVTEQCIATGGSTVTEMQVSVTRCLTLCLTEQCTSAEITQDGRVCHVYRGSYLYRIPLIATDIIPDAAYITYQQQGTRLY